MAAISSRTEGWNNHTFSEVETHLKGRLGTISTASTSSNVQSTCSITGAANDGKMEIIIYVNSGSSDYTVTVPTTYKTSTGGALELTCPSGGYCEVNYLNIGGTIYARGL